METTLFHVFRNTPSGREILLQSLYFCKQAGASIIIYVPEHTKFLMYFDNDVVQVDLDGSYLTDPATAQEHVKFLTETAGITPRLIQPRNFTASTLPDLPVDFDFMCCPRSISDLSTKVSLGHIGPKVRRIINSARFPVLIPSSLFREWDSIIVFFGGSVNAVKALKLGLRLSRITGKPLDIFTHAGTRGKAHYEEILQERNMDQIVGEKVRNWYCFENGTFEHELWQVPCNSLVVLGAYGHGVVKEVLFGSTMEMVQSVVTNTMLIVGPNYIGPQD
ncbi:MAG: universal stress protein [Pseudomonadota bacterium]